MKKKTLWGILAAVTALWLVSVAVYWDTILMYVAPQVPIQAAFGQVCDNLEARYQESPVPILLGGYDESGFQTASLELRSTSGAEGKLKVQVDLNHNQIFAEGTLPGETGLGEICLYLNRDHAALTSETLLAGGYYGFRYDAFSQEIQAQIVGLETLMANISYYLPKAMYQEAENGLNILQTSAEKMNEMVDTLQEKMNWEISLPALPQIDMETIKSASVALWALRGKVSAAEAEVNGKNLPCYKVVYTVEGETAELLWKLLSVTPFPEDAQLQVTFYLYQKSLVKVELSALAEGQRVSGALTLGEDCQKDDLSLEVSFPGGKQISAHLRQQDLITNIQGKTYAYQWNPQTGELSLKLPERNPVALKLSKSGNGFRIETNQIDKLLKLDFFADYRCAAAITKGADIQPPEYKDMDLWSLSDLLILLNGVWNVVKPK